MKDLIKKTSEKLMKPETGLVPKRGLVPVPKPEVALLPSDRRVLPVIIGKTKTALIDHGKSQSWVQDKVDSWWKNIDNPSFVLKDIFKVVDLVYISPKVLLL